MSKQEALLPDSLFLDLDRAGPIPLYFQVEQRIESALASGQLPPGARLENEVSLAQRLGLSRPTVRRAIQGLVDRGMLVRRRGIGTQVVSGPVTRKVALTSLMDDLEAAGRNPATRVLELGTEPAQTRIAGILGVPERSTVVHLRRLRMADGLPIAVMENYLPAEYADLATADLESYGLYRLMALRGVTTRVARQHIGARSATSEEGALLDIPRNAPVLTMDRTAFDRTGRAVEYGNHAYRPDRYSFEVTVVAK